MIEKEERNKLLTEILSVLAMGLMMSKDGIDSSNCLDELRPLIDKVYANDEVFSSHIDAMVLAAIKILSDDFDPNMAIEFKLVTIKKDD